MGWDFAEATVRVLTGGLPAPPPVPVPGVTFPVAVHRGERLGAVLFLRMWRNGRWDSDMAITERDGEGWVAPWSCGGGGWGDPYQRPEDGWDGEPLLIHGSASYESERDDGSVTRASAIAGVAAPKVARILCTNEATTFTYEVDSPLGAFVIVVEGDDPSLVGLGNDGVPVVASRPDRPPGVP
jgi:hypothetical protein